MIYTVTLNPALDRTISIKEICYDDANRIEREEKYAGGKGIDVSRVLTHLGTPNRALGFLGGYTGMEIEGILLQEGIYCEFTQIANETRTNIVLDISTGNRQVLFSARGAAINPAELTEFFRKLENLKSARYLVFSGSLPPGLSSVIYARSIEAAKANGAITFLDTDGENLKTGMTGKPHIIKPNIHELSRLIGHELSQQSDIVKAATEIHQRGIEIVLVSMGAKGMLMVTKDQTCLATPPQVKVVNTIGAGDSAVAGFIHGQTEALPLIDSLRYAVAAGTATTTQNGTALAHSEDIKKLLPEVRIRDL